MANLKASLIWRCKTENGWKRFPVVSIAQAPTHEAAVIKSANGRIPKGAVTIAGKLHNYPQGAFYVRSYNGRKFVYEKVEGGSAEALAALALAESKLDAKHKAKQAGLEVVDDNDDEGEKLTQQRERFMSSKQLIAASTTMLSYRIALNIFFTRCAKKYAAEIDREDIVDFVATIRKSYAPNTVFLYYSRLTTFLNYCGLPKHLLNKRERPKKPKDKPKPYSLPEIARLFAAINSSFYALVFETLLKTGIRKQELMYLQWGDIDFEGKRIYVRNKPKLGFRTKSREERSIPLMDPQLLDRLAAWKKQHKDWRFIFGMNNGANVNTNILHWLKRWTRNGGLNCGHCEMCLSKNKCDNWTIHKFRHTFATQCMRKGINPRTLQAWLGHASLDITMKYLASLTDDVIAVEQMTNVFDDLAVTQPKVVAIREWVPGSRSASRHEIAS